MVLLKLKNPNITDLERTQLTADASAAATSLSVDNTEGYAANNYIVVGELGTEGAEQVRITAITDDTTLAVTALVFAHSDNDPVLKTLFNQLRVYNNADGFGTSIATVNIDWNNPNGSTHHTYELFVHIHVDDGFFYSYCEAKVRTSEYNHLISRQTPTRNYTSHQGRACLYWPIGISGNSLFG